MFSNRPRSKLPNSLSELRWWCLGRVASGEESADEADAERRVSRGDGEFDGVERGGEGEDDAWDGGELIMDGDISD